VRIYEGTPRQDWEEVLRSIGRFADAEGLKDLLFLERDGGFLLQGLRYLDAGAAADSFGSLGKRSYELSDEKIAELMEGAFESRGEGGKGPDKEITNYYEMALRLIGSYVDKQRPHDVFFFEQEGSFVVRLFAAGSQAGAHSLAEFTREDMLGMIEEAQQQPRK
jgi:hypothetical protein